MFLSFSIIMNIKLNINIVALIKQSNITKNETQFSTKNWSQDL